MIARIVAAAFAVLAAILAIRLHHATADKAKAEFDLGLASSRVLSAKFMATGELRAALLTGEVLSAGACTSGLVFNNDQQTIAPYRVEYMVDLAKVDRSRFRWDARDRMMFVEVPDIVIEAPAVDMSRARSRQSGLFISRACGLAMQQQVAGRLSAAAAEKAGRADYRAGAAMSARLRVAQLVRSSLVAAGLADVTVRVRFPSDPRPAASAEWDRSRSIAQVLADPRYRP